MSFSISTSIRYAAAGRKSMRVLRAVERCADSARAGPSSGTYYRTGADDGGAARRPPLVDRAARAECDVVVVSLFVNPAQFNESADLDRYPRREQRDRELAGAAGADLLLRPRPRRSTRPASRHRSKCMA